MSDCRAEIRRTSDDQNCRSTIFSAVRTARSCPVFVGFAPPIRSDGEALEPLDAGDEVTATYALPEELPAGAYVSRGLFFVSWNVPGQTPEEHGAYLFELTIAVE